MKHGGTQQAVRAERQAESELTPVLQRNIESLHQRRQRETEAASAEDRIADALTRFVGSMRFVYLHLFVFGFWIAANLRWLPAVPAWDESFVSLAVAASLEAIFLSTFVLITQNRMALAADKRADLDLQISLLTEHEITKVASLVSAIADRLNVNPSVVKDIAEVEREIAPEAVLDAIDEKRPQ